LWAKQFSGLTPNYGYAVTTDSQGSIYITGEFSVSVDFDPNVGTQNLITTGGPDAFIAKLNSQGDFRSANQLGSSSSSVTVTNIVLDNNENLFAPGRFGGGSVDFDSGMGINNISSNSGLDAYIYKINSSQTVSISELNKR
tara:strand:+ start:14122 stop:14544 length:423 start_codon:yes stop_codon:yes gene_type:complete